MKPFVVYLSRFTVNDEYRDPLMVVALAVLGAIKVGSKDFTEQFILGEM